MNKNKRLLLLLLLGGVTEVIVNDRMIFIHSCSINKIKRITTIYRSIVGDESWNINKIKKITTIYSFLKSET